MILLCVVIIFLFCVLISVVAKDWLLGGMIFILSLVLLAIGLWLSGAF